jgi:hypothetical protein
MKGKFRDAYDDSIFFLIVFLEGGRGVLVSRLSWISFNFPFCLN